MEEEIDPYERQLLAVFKSCDRDGSGILDLNGFGQLCDALQLEENHRSQLVKRLCTNGKCSVAFSQFRDALLAVLASLRSTNEELNNQNASNYELTEHEVTPKFMFGGKKYGRRSRPASTDQEEEKSDECVSPTDTDDTFIMRMDYTKSADDLNKQMNDEENNFKIEALCKHFGVHKETIVRSSELISVCSTLGMSNSMYDMIQENIMKLEDKAEFTYGQLFEWGKYLGFSSFSSANIGTSGTVIASTTPFTEDGIASVDINASGSISYDTLVYLFENAGINDAGVFLNDLGISPQFDVNLSELATQLQEELINVQRCMDNSSNHLPSLLNPHLLLLQASVVVSQAQIKWYRSCVEQMQCERDKLRNDLSVANERASLLAQEVDDNHTRMENSIQQKLHLLEQKHADQVKKLTYQWSIEREQLTNQNIKMEKQLEQLLHDETKLRSEVASLKQDYENLEKENRNLLDQLVNAENVKDELEREIQRLSLLKKKVLELESSNEQAISFLEKMNQLQAENIMLRDKNDELAVALENVTIRQMQNRSSCSKRRGNSPLEGEDNSDNDMASIATHRMYPKVRKYSTEKDLSIGLDGPIPETLSNGLMTNCESGIEADISTSSSSLDRIGEAIIDASEKTILELRSRVSFLESFIRKFQFKVPDGESSDLDVTDNAAEQSDRSADDLEKQCETLQLRLDQVQKEILKLLSEKRACSEENCALKMKISELMKDLPSSKLQRGVATTINSSLETIKNGGFGGSWSDESNNSDTLKADTLYEKRVFDDSEAVHYVENESRTASEYQSSMNRSSSPERHSVRTQTVDTSCSSMFATVSEEENEMEWKTLGDERKSTESVGDNEGACNETKSSRNFDKLLQDYERLTQENKTLRDKCDELSSCLDMLRNEYDQCEDYWASKLDEERKLFEEEQRISDEKFAELQQKIDEYSELFDAESMSSQAASKLPPIAENDKLEKEVNDLQEEFKTYKETMELENREKQKEIERLMQIISLYETTGSYKYSNRGVEQSLESIKSDRTYVLDKPSSGFQEIPHVEEIPSKQRDSKLAELKQRKKHLRKECDKLERERETLIEQLMKLKSESRPIYNVAPCSHAIQQHNAEVMKNGILLRLRHQEMRNRNLRNLLLQQQKKLNKKMKDTLDQHAKELVKYRSALTSSEEMWQSLQETTKKQAEQIAQSDVLVKELYCENSQLMATIHQLEQQHLDCPSSVLL